MSSIVQHSSLTTNHHCTKLSEFCPNWKRNKLATLYSWHSQMMPCERQRCGKVRGNSTSLYNNDGKQENRIKKVGAKNTPSYEAVISFVSNVFMLLCFITKLGIYHSASQSVLTKVSAFCHSQSQSQRPRAYGRFGRLHRSHVLSVCGNGCESVHWMVLVSMLPTYRPANTPFGTHCILSLHGHHRARRHIWHKWHARKWGGSGEEWYPHFDFDVPLLDDGRTQ